MHAVDTYYSGSLVFDGAFKVGGRGDRYEAVAELVSRADGVCMHPGRLHMLRGQGVALFSLLRKPTTWPFYLIKGFNQWACTFSIYF